MLKIIVTFVLTAGPNAHYIMEIKHTFEILIKDIQDIEKLVGNLQNSPEASVIEMDLAMAKLRNVYEVLAMIRTDILKGPEPVIQEQKVLLRKDKKVPIRKDKEAEILADKFSSESSINENLAVKRGGDMENKLSGQPIENIARSIGINDRFFIIRELFDGNSDGFRTLIDNLDDATNYKDASQLIEERFKAHIDHEGVGILFSLVKRRFSTS